MPLRRLAGIVRGGEADGMTACFTMQMHTLRELPGWKNGEVEKVEGRGLPLASELGSKEVLLGEALIREECTGFWAKAAQLNQRN